MTVGAEGEVEFDSDVFQTAYESDADAVEELLTAFEGATSTQQSPADGVSVTYHETSVSLGTVLEF